MDDAAADGLSAEEAAIVAVVREFVDREVRPVARELEHANAYPEQLIEQMKRLGIFGLAVPEPWGEAQVSTQCYAAVTEELSRGWMSLAGAMGGHTVVAKLLVTYGTPEQRDRYLPKMATGEVRATMALTEPGGGSDLQAMRTTARPAMDGGYVVNGSKTWITNARRSQLVALLCKTDPDATPAHKGISILLAEHGPGFSVSRDLPKLGYKGVESCELAFDDFHAPATALLGGAEGQGFAQMMRGLEIGRIQVASRALGVGRAALEDALRYAQQRESFGKPIWRHQSVGNYLADMATKLEAARQLVRYAARRYDSGQRSDMEAGMAKLFASETAMEIALNAVRIHGGYGYSTEYDVERYFRDAPLMIVGEGTNEIQRSVITRQLIERHPIRRPNLTVRDTDSMNDVIERTEILDPAAARALGDLLGAPVPDLGSGAGLPPLWHWVYLLERAPVADLGPDGHPVRGTLPAPPGPGLRRMWAGGRVRVRGALRCGEPATKRTQVLSVTEKRGRSGRLTFVTAGHQVLQGGVVVVDEEQDIVYREAADPPATAPVATAPHPAPGREVPAREGEREITVSPVVLFRFSALTYNAHRVHYDRDYCRDVEGYPGLLTHGPLQAILMAEAARAASTVSAASGGVSGAAASAAGHAGGVTFDYRLVAPLFDHQGLFVSAADGPDGATLTAVRDRYGRQTATGTFRRGR